MEYFVIKDKTTGNYFRGKGVNRWGKFLNQASIYRVLGQAKDSLEHIKRTRRVHDDLEADPVIIKIAITEIGIYGENSSEPIPVDFDAGM